MASTAYLICVFVVQLHKDVFRFGLRKGKVSCPGKRKGGVDLWPCSNPGQQNVSDTFKAFYHLDITMKAGIAKTFLRQ